MKLLREYAATNGFDVLQECVDVETAKRAGRTGFTEMVGFFKKQMKSRVESGNRHILLVEKTDRLYRNIKDWVTLDELDLEIHLVKENVVLASNSNSSVKFMHGIRVLMAKNYIDNLGEETKKGMREKAEQGIYPSAAPVGYRNVAGSHDKRTIEPDPESAPIIQRLFESYATGNYSLRDLTKKAYEDGLRSRTGTKMARSSIHAMISNPIYYGDFVWTGKRYRGIHEPLITKNLFDRAQDVLTDKGQRRTHQQKHDWAFQGLVSCGATRSRLSNCPTRRSSRSDLMSHHQYPRR